MAAEPECEDAYVNPKCPYVTQINQHGSDVSQIKTALVGEDLQGGLVAKVQRLETFMKIAVFVSGAVAVAVVGIAVKMIFGV
jgi:hypothetical protein